MKTIPILLLLASSAVAQTPSLSSVRVYVFQTAAKFPQAWGSGVYISENQVLTNFHVVNPRRKMFADPLEFFETGVVEDDKEHPESVQVRFSDGQRRWATVEAEDYEADIALLRIVPHETITPLPMGNNAIRGSTVRLHGFGYDYEYKLLRATVSYSSIRRKCGKEDIANGSEICTTPKTDGPWVVLAWGESSPGDSGGPFTQNGKLSGLVFGRGNGYSHGIHIDSIRKIFGEKIK